MNDRSRSGPLSDSVTVGASARAGCLSIGIASARGVSGEVACTAACCATCCT
ncbi:hypothetical protein [Lysobacter gummosus]|uniref:hypothetical protein n=1 Tax=Lysobacter gummosus TaxID=262324 RepID=UPI003645D7E1